MKKLSFFLAFICSLTQSRSQAYYKMLPTDTMVWQHFNCITPVGPSGKSASFSVWDMPIVAIDTISINSFKYKKVYQLGNYVINYTNKALLGYMREDTIARKIMFRETTTSPDNLLYDFSLSVGDSVMLTNAFFNTGYYRADSIVIKNTQCGPRKHFYMRKHQNNSTPSISYYVWIESIGCTHHVLYQNAQSPQTGCQLPQTATCKHPWILGLSCKHNNLKKQYQSCTYTLAQGSPCMNPIDSCNYRNYCSNIKSNYLSKNIHVFPNPASDHLKITLDEPITGLITLEIYDLTGRLLLSEKNENKQKDIRELEIKVDKLQNGTYFLRINNYYVQEILISR